MPLSSLVSDEFQDDESLTYTYRSDEYPGIEWTFVSFKTGRESRKIAALQEEHADNPDVNYTHCLLAGMTIATDGPLSKYPEAYRAPILDAAGKPTVDPKTGKYKTKKHPLAGKKIPMTPDNIATMNEAFLNDVVAQLVVRMQGRSDAEQESFRSPNPAVVESVDQ